MDRKHFLARAAKMGVCSCTLVGLFSTEGSASNSVSSNSDVEKLTREKEFILNWLDDLFDAMDNHLDRETQVKLLEHCGKSCFNRFQFKKDIAIAGKGDLEKLLQAYKNNFGISREGNFVHIKYGGGHCFCPAAIGRQGSPDDVHCECTRMTHQSIFETALERPIKVDIIESVRRGGKTCHFKVHV